MTQGHRRSPGSSQPLRNTTWCTCFERTTFGFAIDRSKRRTGDLLIPKFRRRKRGHYFKSMLFIKTQKEGDGKPYGSMTLIIPSPTIVNAGSPQTHARVQTIDHEKKTRDTYSYSRIHEMIDCRNKGGLKEEEISSSLHRCKINGCSRTSFSNGSSP